MLNDFNNTTLLTEIWISLYFPNTTTYINRPDNVYFILVRSIADVNWVSGDGQADTETDHAAGK